MGHIFPKAYAQKIIGIGIVGKVTTTNQIPAKRLINKLCIFHYLYGYVDVQIVGPLVHEILEYIRNTIIHKFKIWKAATIWITGTRQELARLVWIVGQSDAR